MAITEAVRKVAENEERREGTVTRAIERQTAKVPSIIFLNLAFASMAASLTIATTSKKAEWANFVGLWAPAFLLLGIYNKLVKQVRSDA